MKYHKENCIDASEKDKEGNHEYYYEYTLYSFENEGVTLVARSYRDAYEEVCFLNKSFLGEISFFKKEDENTEFVKNAISVLKRDEHKKVIRFLFEE